MQFIRNTLRIADFIKIDDSLMKNFKLFLGMITPNQAWKDWGLTIYILILRPGCCLRDLSPNICMHICCPPSLPHARYTHIFLDFAVLKI
jgi:hypothetical protein